MGQGRYPLRAFLSIQGTDAISTTRRVSLFIPTWNAGPLLERVLDAIEGQHAGVELEKVAIDSGSRDRTVDVLAAHGFNVHRIPQSEFDHGATRDRGIEMCSGDVVVLLTQDAVPADASWLRWLLAPYEDPRVAGVYCRQIPRADCNPILAERLRAWTAGKDRAVVQEVDGPEAFERLPPLEKLSRSAFDNVASSVRRSVWKEFPFGRRNFGEDVTWGKRVVLAGHRIVFEPRAAVIHSHNRSPWAEFKRLYCDHQNLNDLFGLTLIPRASGLLHSIRTQREAHRRVLRGLQMRDDERHRWWQWAKKYAVCEVLGIFLGARSNRWRRRGAFWFPALDRWIKKGI
jgi:rhamnosyltransferase